MSLIYLLCKKIKEMILYIQNILPRKSNKDEVFQRQTAAIAVCNAILQYDNITCISLINSHPGCVNTPTGPEGYTPFLVSCLYGNTQVAKVMLQFGADVSQTSSFGESPFYLATFCNLKNINDKNASCLNLLYYAGSDINAFTNKGFNPLQLAAMFGKTNLVKWLLMKGANPSVTPHPYILARSQGFQNTAAAILKWEREKHIFPALREIEENIINEFPM